MSRETGGTDWDDIEDGMINEWYYASKIMGRVFEPDFPHFVFKAIVHCIREDPEYKKKEE